VFGVESRPCEAFDGVETVGLEGVEGVDTESGSVFTKVWLTPVVLVPEIEETEKVSTGE